jgi:biotin carboxylase
MTAAASPVLDARPQAVGAGDVAVIHPYSTGRFLAAALGAAGRPAVAVIPEHPIPLQNASSLVPGDYRDVITDTGRPAELVARLLELGVTQVIPGCETGVILADVLAAGLADAGLPGVLRNDPATSSARRDKGLMAAALKANGLDHTRTVRASSAALATVAAGVIGWPVVVKPPRSSGADSVRICTAEAEVADAWQAIAGHNDQLGQANADALVQEYLTGRQCVVNSVTVRGQDGRPRHYVHEVWADRRRVIPGGYTVYDRMDLLPPDDRQALAAARYTAKALDAVELSFGPAHTEIIRCRRGWVLIEVNPRLAGMIDPAFSELATGQDQVSLTAEAITDPAGFASRHDGCYPVRGFAAHIWLAAPRAGHIAADVLAEILALPTVRSAVGHIEPGAAVTTTIDLATAPGYFALFGERAQVERDALTIRTLEQAGLYQ